MAAKRLPPSLVPTSGVGVPHWGHLLFIAPFVLVYMALLIVPLVRGLYLSFFEVDALSGESTFAGIDNFVQLAHDEVFRGAVINTFAFVLMTTPAFVAVGLGLALALKQSGAVRAGLRAIFFGASVLSVTIVTLVWRLVFMTDRGLLANAMKAIGLDPVNPLVDPQLALPAVALVTVWWIIGLPMMLFLAALQQIPQDVYEAASLDNASRWRTFRSITLPAIKRSVALVAVIEVIAQFQLFGQVQLMTQGGPNNSTRPIVQFIFESGFNQWAIGYAAAAAQVLFGLMLIAVVIQVRIAARRDAQ